MSSMEGAKAEKKEALKNLREARRQTIERAVRTMKTQRKAIDAVKRQLAEGGKTVPELAEASGLSTADTMWYVATLKKYGVVAEGEKDGSYFRYELTADATKSASEPHEEG
jgi:hypothetical protein